MISVVLLLADTSVSMRRSMKTTKEGEMGFGAAYVNVPPMSMERPGARGKYGEKYSGAHIEGVSWYEECVARGMKLRAEADALGVSVCKLGS